MIQETSLKNHNPPSKNNGNTSTTTENSENFGKSQKINIHIPLNNDEPTETDDQITGIVCQS